MPADVAAQPFGGAVECERHAAVRARADVPAGLAEHRGGKSAAVQEQDRLLAFRDPPLDRLLERKREDPSLGRSARRLPEIDDADDRHALVIDPVVQADEPVFSSLGIVPALEARGRAAEEHGRLLAVAAQDGHVAGMVARCLVLLIGILVLLVHDDDAQVFERRKNRAARADDDPRGPAVDLVPFVVALAVGEVAVQDRNFFLHVREAGFEAFHRLRGQCDFRHQHERGAPAIHRLADST